jgi:hypothetical protein
VKKLVFLTALFMLLKPAIPFLEYVVNYDYIVKELCENKEKLQLQCNGKCHLKKELAKSAADEQSPADKKQNSKQEIEVLFYQETPIFFQKMPVVFTDKKVNASYQNFYALTAIQSTFHPPIC